MEIESWLSLFNDWREDDLLLYLLPLVYCLGTDLIGIYLDLNLLYNYPSMCLILGNKGEVGFSSYNKSIILRLLYTFLNFRFTSFLAANF